MIPKMLKDTDWFYLPEEYDVKKALIESDEDKKEFREVKITRTLW
jgi:hypothetical protein